MTDCAHAARRQNPNLTISHSALSNCSARAAESMRATYTRATNWLAQQESYAPSPRDSCCALGESTGKRLEPSGVDTSRKFSPRLGSTIRNESDRRGGQLAVFLLRSLRPLRLSATIAPSIRHLSPRAVGKPFPVLSDTKVSSNYRFPIAQLFPTRD